MLYFCPTQNDMHTRDTLWSNVWYFGLNFPSSKYDTVLLFCEAFWVFSLWNMTPFCYFVRHFGFSLFEIWHTVVAKYKWWAVGYKWALLFPPHEMFLAWNIPVIERGELFNLSQKNSQTVCWLVLSVVVLIGQLFLQDSLLCNMRRTW